MSLMIRQATPADVDTVAAIESICFPPAEGATKQALCERLAAFTTSFLVAELDHTIVGFINGCITNQDTLTDDLYDSTAKHDVYGANMMVFGLDVLPDYQHHGIAQALMQAYIGAGKRMKKKAIILTCKERLIPFYEQFGYVCQGKSASTHGGVIWYDMVLTL